MANEKLHIDLSMLPSEARKRLIAVGVSGIMADKEIPFEHRTKIADALLRSHLEAVQSDSYSPSSFEF